MGCCPSRGRRLPAQLTGPSRPRHSAGTVCRPPSGVDLSTGVRIIRRSRNASTTGRGWPCLEPVLVDLRGATLNSGDAALLMSASGTMRAARFHGGGRVSVVKVEIPTPGPRDVLLRVHANALCGSDRHAYDEGSEVIPGHEIAGTVVSRGDEVHDIAAGDRGVVYLVDYCGACRACTSASPNTCLSRRGMIGFTQDGGLAELVCVPAHCFLPVPAEMELDAATALLDLFGTTLHALRRAGRDVADADVAVVGCGPIGIGAIAVARALGARSVHAFDLVPYRLRLAETLGAMVVDGRSSDPVQVIREQLPDGCAIVIEAAGRPETQRMALELAGPDGRVVFVAHTRAPLALQTSADLIQFERVVIGCEYFPLESFHETLDLVLAGRLDPGPLLTHRYSLDDVQAGYEAFFSGDTGKVLVLP
jgi:threonine 3-dehydrogenase